MENQNKDKNKELTQKEKDLIKKYESGKVRKTTFNDLKDLYYAQTDRNYKDGDRN